jgi:hypothetical protein
MMNNKDIKEHHDLDKLKQYQPLPSGLTITDSRISGQGLFTTRKLVAETNLGMSHVELGKLILRTPMGGFINHSNNPNCVRIKSLLTRQEWNHRTDLPDDKYDLNFTKWNLMVMEDIEEGEELTLKYKLYVPEKK